MSLTYLDISIAARDMNVWFDFVHIPRGIATRMASDIQRDLLVKAAKRDPDGLSTTTTLTGATVVASLGTPPLPVALPSALQYVRARVVTTGSSDQPDDLELITADHLSDWSGQGYWLQGSAAYFTGTTADWSNAQSVIVTYIPSPVDFTANTDLIALPDHAKGAFAARLAFAYAMRVNGMPASTDQPVAVDIVKVDVSMYAQLATKAEQEWLALLSDQRRKSRLTIPNGADFR